MVCQLNECMCWLRAIDASALCAYTLFMWSLTLKCIKSQLLLAVRSLHGKIRRILWISYITMGLSDMCCSALSWDSRFVGDHTVIVKFTYLYNQHTRGNIRPRGIRRCFLSRVSNRSSSTVVTVVITRQIFGDGCI